MGGDLRGALAELNSVNRKMTGLATRLISGAGATGALAAESGGIAPAAFAVLEARLGGTCYLGVTTEAEARKIHEAKRKK